MRFKSITAEELLAVYLLLVGDIPDGLYVCHSCDERLCCNPDHLWLGTAKQNQQDMAAKGRVYSAAKFGLLRRDAIDRFSSN